MRTYKQLLAIFLLISYFPINTGCNLVNNKNQIDQTLSYELSDSPAKWEHFFVNYSSLTDLETMEFDGGFSALPSPLDTTKQAYFLTSNNRSDNVAMFIKGEVKNLEPSRTYEAQFKIKFATNAPSDCFGPGGSPGESVRVNAVLTKKEPLQIAEQRSNGSEYYLLNLDKDFREENNPEGGLGWYNVTKLGNIANNKECPDSTYEYKTVTSPENHWEFETDKDGTAWLLFGTRSGYESVTRIYFTDVEIYLRKN